MCKEYDYLSLSYRVIFRFITAFNMTELWNDSAIWYELSGYNWTWESYRFATWHYMDSRGDISVS